MTKFPNKHEKTSKEERENIYKESSLLHSRLQMYAELASPSLKKIFDSYCMYCFASTKIEIRHNEVFYSCSPCATMMADSYN